MIKEKTVTEGGWTQRGKEHLKLMSVKTFESIASSSEGIGAVITLEFPSALVNCPA